MKGITKAIMRTPHMVGSKVGMSKKSNDAEFDDHPAISPSSFHPIASEYDLLGKFPQAAHTIKNVDAYHTALEELRTSISPELELIESRVVGPVKELQGIMKAIRKMITKRQHKLEQDFEIASNEYENLNAAMKQDLPRFMTLSTRFIDPLFHSFYYMQLNIFYMIIDKISQFSEGKYTIDLPAAQVAAEFEEKRGDSAAVVEALSITQRFISTSKLVSQNRSSSTGGVPSVGRSASIASSSSAVSPSYTSSTSFKKNPPPPPPAPFGSGKKESVSTSPVIPPAAAPPPYSAANPASTFSAVAAAAKRAPPPPPPLKPKPAPVNYVVALYDFAAQADGDLDFKVGDRIEVIERTDSAEDWWTGRLDGRTGVFPGNYVQEA
ncbi:BAR-domain-containing protein [Russula earlei]|uniref:BAR-domain-containing protein n=1 Tax=Russula earlei TaxID=71964 RepID=A0ACC0ULB9_9AGAM|nr:BAR-domain-containing protein [Russula earlei]